MGTRIGFDTKKQPLGTLQDQNKSFARFSGTVEKSFSSYCFIGTDNYPMSIFYEIEAGRNSLPAEGSTVTFEIAFNMFGPVAVAPDEQ